MNPVLLARGLRRGVFRHKKKLLQDKRISVEKRVLAFYRYAGPAFLYGSEGWILAQAMAKAIKAWIWERTCSMLGLRRRSGSPGVDYPNLQRHCQAAREGREATGQAASQDHGPHALRQGCCPEGQRQLCCWRHKADSWHLPEDHEGTWATLACLVS